MAKNNPQDATKKVVAQARNRAIRKVKASFAKQLASLAARVKKLEAKCK